jgi:hypothetical protein
VVGQLARLIFLEHCAPFDPGFAPRSRAPAPRRTRRPE